MTLTTNPGVSIEGQAPSALIVYRHPLPIRIFHWVNALCVVILLMSGLQIFNAHPRLYVGDTGYVGVPAVFEITGNKDFEHPQSWIQIGTTRIATTGFLGVATEERGVVSNLAFPAWMRLPSSNDLGRGRGWHFLAVWFFALNGFLYLLYGALSGRFQRELMPTRKQMGMSAILRTLWMHIRLRHPTGAEALAYNLFQKVAYLGVIFALSPLMILTGMTMSNTAVAGFPWLIEMFGGRQTARLIHFTCAMFILTFIFVHVFQVFIAGFRREMRSIVTGYYIAPKERK